MHKLLRLCCTYLCAILISTPLVAEHRVTTLIRPRPALITSAYAQSLFTYQLSPAQQKRARSGLSFLAQSTKTFRPERIAQCLFSDDVLINTDNIAQDKGNPFLAIKRSCESMFTVAGTGITTCACHRWLANYFALPPDFKSTVYVKPQVNNEMLLFEAFHTFQIGSHSGYGSIITACNHSSWHLHARENVINPGKDGYSPGVFGPTALDRAQLQQSFLDFASGEPHLELKSIIIEPLVHAKISCSRRQITNLADIQATLGWYAYSTERHLVTVDAKLTIPTGNKPHGIFLFEPLSGNCHHWQLGASATAHLTLFEHEKTGNSCLFLLALTVSHLFSTKQMRTFDIKNIPNSRYILAQKVGNVPSYFAPLANLTTLPARVSVPIEILFALAFRYTTRQYSWDIGYKFWGQSSEHICINERTPFNTQEWQLFTSEPFILSTSDIDVTSARTKLRTHNLFMLFKYSLRKRDQYTPFIGCGAHVDFGQSAQPTAPSSVQRHLNCALSFWGIWAQFGLVFD